VPARLPHNFTQNLSFCVRAAGSEGWLFRDLPAGAGPVESLVDDPYLPFDEDDGLFSTEGDTSDDVARAYVARLRLSTIPPLHPRV
jgi:hypothetical protein